MILVDVNLLVYALNTDLPAQQKAKAWLEELFHQRTPVGLPWAVLVGFVRIATNPRIFRQALTIEQATTIVQGWLARPNVTVLHPTREHLRHFTALCPPGKRDPASPRRTREAGRRSFAICLTCRLPHSGSLRT